MIDTKKILVGIVILSVGLAAGYFLGDRLGHRHEGPPAVVEKAAGGLWTCGMHPQVIQDEPGFCPICQIALVPFDASPEEKSAESVASGEMRIDPTVLQNMNLRTAKIERRDLTRPIRTVGYLDFDQERMVTVTTKNSGWVEKVHVNYVGESVRAGQPLFEVFSPELVQTEQELLSALEFAAGMQDAPPDARRRAEALVDAARVRLGYWDIAKEQIRALEENGQVFRTLNVVSPSTGTVMKRLAGLEGMAVQPGMEIFHLADLRSLWLSVEIFEEQIAWIREGSEAEITLSYFPGKTYRGTVRNVEPEFSEKTRTLQATILVKNPDLELKKGMFATVIFSPMAVADALTVPSQAVLRTGRRNVVVLALADGRFVPREVVLGYEADEYVQILEGVAEGEEVVTSAQFLLDSESTLREAVRKMIEAKTSPPPAGHQH